MKNETNPTPNPDTFRVLVDALPFVEAKLEAAGKKAVKLGFPVPELVIERYVNVTAEGGKVTRYAEVKVLGDAPKLNGWTFVSTLQILSTGEAVIRTIPGETLPKTFHEADPTRCEHCGWKRNRLDTFVLRHEDGTWKQVGRTCLRDFLGHPSPESVARYADLLFQIRESMEAAGDEKWYGANGGSRSYALDLTEFLAGVAEEVRLHGWLSSTAARGQEKTPTADIVWNKFFPVSAIGSERPSPNEADRKEAEAAVAWAESLTEPDPSEYLHNVRVIGGLGAVEYRIARYAGSILVAYKRAKDDAARAERSAEWIGTLNEEGNFSLRFKGAVRNAAGTCYVVRFEDGNGNEAVWFSRTKPELVEGRLYVVRAKVAGHDVFRGAKSTKLMGVTVNAPQVPRETVESDRCPF